MTKDVCHAARERPVRMRWLCGLGNFHSRTSERVDCGRGVANDSLPMVGSDGEACWVGMEMIIEVEVELGYMDYGDTWLV